MSSHLSQDVFTKYLDKIIQSDPSDLTDINNFLETKFSKSSLKNN